MKLKPLLAALLVSALAAGCTHVDAPAPEADSPMVLENFDAARLSTAIFDETNRVRVLNHCKALKPSEGLDAAADVQAAYTALTLKAGHFNPASGQANAAERVAYQNVPVAHVGENAIMMGAQRSPGDGQPIYGYREFAALLVEGWMNSPDHRENLLAPRFTMLGCAARLSHAFRQGDLRIFAVQVFAQPPSERDDGGTRSKFSPAPAQ